jgi:hypothetical protein
VTRKESWTARQGETNTVTGGLKMESFQENPAPHVSGKLYGDSETLTYVPNPQGEIGYAAVNRAWKKLV